MFLRQFRDQVVQQVACKVVPVEIEGSKQLQVVFTLAKGLVVLLKKHSVFVHCPDVGKDVNHCHDRNTALFQGSDCQLLYGVESLVKTCDFSLHRLHWA